MKLTWDKEQKSRALLHPKAEPIVTPPADMRVRTVGLLVILYDKICGVEQIIEITFFLEKPGATSRCYALPPPPFWSTGFQRLPLLPSWTILHPHPLVPLAWMAKKIVSRSGSIVQNLSSFGSDVVAAFLGYEEASQSIASTRAMR